MATDLQQQLDSIRAKAHVVGEKYRVAHQALVKANAEIMQLKAQVMALEKDLQQARTELEFLRMASIINPDHASLENTKAVIASMVREIDRVIADLIE